MFMTRPRMLIKVCFLVFDKSFFEEVKVIMDQKKEDAA